MNDITGREIKIGDKVVTNISGYTNYLVVRKVIDFTKKKVVLRRENDDTGSSEITKFSEQVAII